MRVELGHKSERKHNVGGVRPTSLGKNIMWVELGHKSERKHNVGGVRPQVW